MNQKYKCFTILVLPGNKKIVSNVLFIQEITCRPLCVESVEFFHANTDTSMLMHATFP